MSKTYIIYPGQTLIVMKSASGENEERREERNEGRHRHHKEVTVTDFTVKDGKAEFDLHL